MDMSLDSVAEVMKQQQHFIGENKLNVCLANSKVNCYRNNIDNHDRNVC